MGRLKDTKWTCRTCNVVFDESSVGGWVDISWPKCSRCVTQTIEDFQKRYYDRRCEKCGSPFTPDNPHDGRDRQAWCQTCLAHEVAVDPPSILCSECGGRLTLWPKSLHFVAGCVKCDRVIRAG